MIFTRRNCGLVLRCAGGDVVIVGIFVSEEDGDGVDTLDDVVPSGIITIVPSPNGLGANSTDGLFSTVEDSLSANGACPGGYRRADCCFDDTSGFVI